MHIDSVLNIVFGRMATVALAVLDRCVLTG